ncbi:HAD-IIB family hydrolase [Myroides sp. DW712]|uniref:HAD-IIB family hydrolase n=1 Tax=Myroides sp. DW712 TaxID=3389800 RepID=UPI0039798A07
MKHIFISDLDGTLLHSKGTLSNTSEKILCEIIETTPHQFGFATARGLTSTAKVVQQIPWNFPVILNNGAVIYDWQTQRVVKIQGMEATAVQEVLKLGKAEGISPFIFTLNESFEEGIFYQSNPSKGLNYFMDKRPNDPRFMEVSHLAEQQKSWETQSLVLMFIEEYETLVPLKLYIQEHFGAELQCLLMQDQYIPNQFVLEVSSAKATKENAIAFLQEQYSIQAENLHLFGDNINDQGMLSLHANTYAVGNAHPQILDIATHRIPTNDQDGVAKTIKLLVTQVLS